MTENHTDYLRMCSINKTGGNMMHKKERFGEKIRRFIHPLVLKVLSFRKAFNLEIHGEIPEDQQFIFIANHWCIDDIPTVAEVINRHVYPLVSDEDRGTLNGFALDLNGVVWTNRLDKAARQHSKDALVRHLKLGHSILMYPEATWNLSPNLPILPMNYGCVSISLETGVPILPIYLKFADDVCQVQINEPFYPSENKIESIKMIRDIMATSAWLFYEKEPILRRATLPTDYWEKNIAQRYSKYDRARRDPDGVRKYEAQFIFRDKNIAYTEEVYAHLSNIIPSKQNAFLVRK